TGRVAEAERVPPRPKAGGHFADQDGAPETVAEVRRAQPLPGRECPRVAGVMADGITIRRFFAEVGRREFADDDLKSLTVLGVIPGEVLPHQLVDVVLLQIWQDEQVPAVQRLPPRIDRVPRRI